MAKKNTPEYYVSVSDRFIDSLVDDVLSGANDATERLLKQLPKYIDKLPTELTKLKKGKDATRLINALEAEIDRIINQSTFPESVAKIARSMPEIEANAKLVLDASNAKTEIDWTKLDLSADRQYAVNTITENLTGGTLSQYVKEPLKQALYRNVSLGASLTETRDTLTALLSEVGNDKYNRMARYATQMAQDGLMQYDGQIYDNFRTTYETNAIRYIGSLISDSRPQCKRWINLKHGAILLKDLQKEINWAFTNGSGMYPGTAPYNFCTYRGGYRCRHRAVPVFLSEKDLLNLAA